MQTNIFDRARQYVSKIPGAISGDHGHDQTFHVACVLVNGFALSESDATSIMREYNLRCSPPWDDSDLERKVREASKASHDKTRGHLIGEQTSYAAPTTRPRMTAEQRERAEAERDKLRLKAKARSGLDSVLSQYPGGFAYFGNRSPVNLLDSDPRNDWKLLLQLFKPDDVVWIGRAPTDSAGPDSTPDWQSFCQTRFRAVSEWLKESTAPGLFTCPSVFKSGIHSRSNDNVTARRYLVVESDTLDKNQVCAVFRWAEQFSRLRAIVDTGGRSLHGWFEVPQAEALEQLRVIMPQMGCDPALFKLAQPCRLPGGVRADKNNRVQSLLYLDLEATK